MHDPNDTPGTEGPRSAVDAPSSHVRHSAPVRRSATDGGAMGGPADRVVASRPSVPETARRAAGELRSINARGRGPVRFVDDQQVPEAGPSPELVRLLAQLRASITVHVRRLRDEGAPPERTLVEVKRLMREAESTEAHSEEMGFLMTEVVRWSIEAYYN